MYDILILNGRIVTGMGSPWFYGDIGVTGGAITAVGRINCGTARTVIDAERRT
jgi:N-acyl-D-amino-acid deacylase